LRTDLESTGRVIGANDLLIASHAMALNCTLVTDNDREFSRIPDLAVENWLA
jgi:tRNA(fMet)-specific endonuclease VapC